MKQYEKYKDSGIAWIGEIPEHWGVERLKNRIKFNPLMSTNNIKDDTSVSYMPMECLRNGIITAKIAKYKIVSSYTPFSDQDIVMAKVTPCFENGNIAIARNLENGVGFGTSEIFVIRCNANIKNGYLFYYLQSPYIKNIGIASMYGTGGLKRINPMILNYSNLLCPPIAEQQAIAEFLDRKCLDIDELVSLQEKMIKELQAYKQSVITETVTKGLDKNAPLKDSGIEWIGEIPEHWRVKKSKYFSKIKSGDSLDSKKINSDGDYEVFGGNGFMGYYNKYNVIGQSIIIGRVGALCGNVKYITKPKFISDNALILKCDNITNYAYCLYILLSANLNQLNTSNAQPLITGSKVMNSFFPFPQLSEQQLIADYLDKKCTEIDKLIAIKKQKIVELKEYKKSVIFEYVTGKKQVSQ